MKEANDPAGPAPAWPGGQVEAQFGPHRFYAGEGGGSAEFRGARFDAEDMRGARFTDCDLTGVTIRDGWGYPDEEHTVIDCISVVMDEEIEHYRFAVRDLAVLEAG